MRIANTRVGLWTVLLLAVAAVAAAEDWPQLKYDCRHSGNVSQRSVQTPLGLIAASPLTDAVFTAPVVAAGRVYVVDGSGVAWCLDAATLKTVWKFASAAAAANCSNVSSPAIADGYLHFGTMAGGYYVLDAASGNLVKRIDTGDPIFSTPVVGNDSVYFATLGSRTYALKPDGTVRWEWDFVREKLDCAGDRWSGEDWQKARLRRSPEEQKRLFWNRQEQFCCNRDIALADRTLVIPAGGAIVWLEDAGERPTLRGTYYSTREAPATLGLSIGETGAVYRQWHRRDNGGSVEVLQFRDGKLSTRPVWGTETEYYGGVVRDAQGKPLPGREEPGMLSFCSVSLRGDEVFRCRPQEGFGLCRHAAGKTTRYPGSYPSIASPILLRDSAVYGGLDGRLYVVPLSGKQQPWSFATAFGKAITAPVAVCDGRVYFGCDDGYLYALGPEGKAALPSEDLGLWKIRSPLGSKLTAPQYDWFTNFGDLANTNANDQGLRPPLKMKWIRRFKGTVKHLSVCGGGRMYTHTAEGQIFAVEQETGRLLWRRYFPGVYVSFTAPIYQQGRLLVPQAGLTKCRLRMLDAATGELLWEAPFTGSPSWNRQLPPIIYKGLAIYLFSSGSYSPKSWLFEHQSTFGSPANHRPLVRAYDIDSGRTVWTRDFFAYGAGGDDAGICLMDGTIYYSCYFGNRGAHGCQGITAAIEPQTGRVLWLTDEYSVHAGCTVSGKDGRLYLGGYNPAEDKTNRVWCLSAKDGSLVWESQPLSRAIHVITIARHTLFTHSQYLNGFLLDQQTGKILSNDKLTQWYRCTRFTLSEPYLVGPNMDLFDISDPGDVKKAWAGPPVDVLFCVGAMVSNGRVFYTTNGAGLQCSAVYGDEAASVSPPWQSETNAYQPRRGASQ